MKSKLLILSAFIFVFTIGAKAQKVNRTMEDPILHRTVMVGPVTQQGLKTGIFSTWFNQQYKYYNPETSIINKIKKNINKVNITAVFGSWCGDSKLQVGRFYKILHDAGYDMSKLKTIAVDRALKAPGLNISSLQIHRIPTFIIYYKGKEIGRIVESPKTSLEKDLENILKKVS